MRAIHSLAGLLFLGSLYACSGGVSSPRDDGAEDVPTGRRGAALESTKETMLWRERSHGMPPRVAPALADQHLRGTVLAYGGWNLDGALRSDTWEWDGFGWIRRVPDQNPGPRFGAAAAFDAKRNTTLLYGGIGAMVPQWTSAPSETWLWDGLNWRRALTERNPGSRTGAALAWDAKTDRTYLFGGLIESPDTPNRIGGDNAFWYFDGYDWHQLPDADGPTPAGFRAMMVDPRTGHLLVSGGVSEMSIVNGQIDFSDGMQRFLSETWEWDGERWRMLPTNLPGLMMSLPSLNFDTVAQEPILTVDWLPLELGDGGITAHTTVYGLTAEGWVMRQDSLRNLLLSSSVWSSRNQQLLLIGGHTPRPGDPVRPISATASAEISTMSATTPWRRWPLAEAPGARGDAARTEMPADGGVLVFGGLSDRGAVLNDMVRWTGGYWTPITLPTNATRPSPRTLAAMAALGPNQAVLFGGGPGNTANTALDDCWIWHDDTRTWTRYEPATEDAPWPSRRQGASMAAFGDGKVLMFGGRDVGEFLDDTWIFSLEEGWSKLPIAGPSGRWRAGALTSFDGQSVHLFGGNEGASTAAISTQYWIFDGSQWQLRPTQNTFGRRSAGFASDRSQRRIYLSGGIGSTVEADTWDLTLVPFTPLAPIVIEDNQEPAERRYGQVFANSPGGGVVTYGGSSIDNDRVTGETWTLHNYGADCQTDNECSAGQHCTEGVCCESVDCGPCRTCAAPARRGLCMPRGVRQAEPGCDANGYVCATDGVCRRDDEQHCQQNEQCASGTCLQAGRDVGICCAAEGCAVRCVDGALRNPEGTVTSCAPYLCQGQSCTTSCTSINDCADGFVCNEGGACVAIEPEFGEAVGCNCRSAGDSPLRWPHGGLSALAAFAWLRWSRRRTSAAT